MSKFKLVIFRKEKLEEKIVEKLNPEDIVGILKNYRTLGVYISKEMN